MLWSCTVPWRTNDCCGKLVVSIEFWLGLLTFLESLCIIQSVILLISYIGVRLQLCCVWSILAIILGFVNFIFCLIIHLSVSILLCLMWAFFGYTIEVSSSVCRYISCTVYSEVKRTPINGVCRPVAILTINVTSCKLSILSHFISYFILYAIIFILICT